MSNKQGIYGFFFLLIAVLVVYGIYGAFFRSEGSCTDGILNQHEEKADCGGECTLCEIVALEPLRVTKEPKVLATEGPSMGSGQAVATFEIYNPNRDYDAPIVPYTLLVYGLEGSLVEEITGDASVRALRRTFVIQGGVKTFSKSITRVEVSLEEPEWERSFSELTPALSLAGNATTTVSGNSVRVSGKVKNERSSAEESVEVIAVLADEYGKELFAARAVLSSIPARGEREFSVAFPASEMLAKLISPARTKVTIQTEY